MNLQVIYCLNFIYSKEPKDFGGIRAKGTKHNSIYLNIPTRCKETFRFGTSIFNWRIRF